MDSSVKRRRLKEKQRQLRRRRQMRLAIYFVAAVLVIVFLIKGIILPIVNRGSGSEETQTVSKTAEQTASDSSTGQEEAAADLSETEEESASGQTEDTDAQRRPVKKYSDTSKVSTMVSGWHEDENGTWYQNADGSYYADGFADIQGDTYYFNDEGYRQTGWVTLGVKDYYFNEDGTYDASKVRPMLCLTFDDGPGEYTDTLLDCLEENGAHATFFMLGQLVGSYPETVQRMVDLGCEIGSHSWDHTQLTTISIDAVAQQFQDTDDALIAACGQAATVARAPYGDGNSEIYETVGKPFMMWSLDSMDWSYLDVEQDYDAVMNGDLTDGSIILMHDIHEPSVEAALKIIPDLIAKGYKLVTIHEMAEAKGVDLQNTMYTDFWQSSLNSGSFPGYTGTVTTDTDSSDSSEELSDGTDTAEDSLTDSSDEDYSEEDYSDEEYSDEDYSEEDGY